MSCTITVLACNATGCATSPNSVHPPLPVLGAGLDVTTKWDSTDIARLHQSATYLGITPAQLQHDAVAALAFITAFHPPATVTPVTIPPADDAAETGTSTWTAVDQFLLRDMARQYSLTPTETQRVAAQIIGFLLALGGH